MRYIITLSSLAIILCGVSSLPTTASMRLARQTGEPAQQAVRWSRSKVSADKLPSRMRVREHEIGPRYLVTVDSLVQQQKLLAPDGAAGDDFGQSVALDGDTAVVGAWLDDNSGGANAGAAYIYVRIGNAWTLQQKITASDGAANANFGFSVSVNGDTAAVGAIQANNGSGQHVGAVYIFTRSGGMWAQQQRIQAADGALNDGFARCVSVSADTLLVTSDADDDSGSNSGSAYVFTRSGTVWTQQQKILASDGSAGDNFGNSAAMSGESIIIGAWQESNAGGSAAGSAYVFTRSGVIWTQQQKLTASDPSSVDFFGTSVSLSGDTAIIGGSLNDGNDSDAGAAYVFTRNAGVWILQQRLHASNFAAGDDFGAAVSVNGDVAIISASLDDNSGGADAGSAYVFTRTGGVWSEQQRFQAPDAAANDSFGNTVAMSGATVVVGSYQDDNIGGVDAGSAYLFIQTAPTVAPASISGRITTPDSMPVAGVTVNLSGARTGKVIADANGTYRFNNIDTNGFYTVTPALRNFHFAPESQSFSLVANKSDAVFTASLDATISGNVIDTADYFVRQHYLDFLGREPDENGFNFWSDQILSCGANAACSERRTINVSAAYFLSIEFQETGGLVDGLYRASYDRAPHYNEFLADTGLVAQNIIVGEGDWRARLDANKQAFVEGWVQRSDFQAAYGGLSNEGFVDALLSHTGVTFSMNERTLMVSGLDNGTSTPANVLRQIVDNERFMSAKRNAAFVMMEYFGYLRRDPDPTGYGYWLNKLNQFDGNFERAEMVKAFINSGEYRQRFAQ